MLILTLRTDKPEAEIGLHDDSRQLIYKTWFAHRVLAETIHQKLRAILLEQQKSLADLEGILVFQGPGSFTGLRIGLSVVNALGYGLGIPLVAQQEPRWLETGLQRLLTGDNDGLALPHYGALPHITKQKK